MLRLHRKDWCHLAKPPANPQEESTFDLWELHKQFFRDNEMHTAQDSQAQGVPGATSKNQWTSTTGNGHKWTYKEGNPKRNM
jgi:hypothetical protein